METALFIFIIIIIGVAFIYSRKTKLGSAEKQKEVKKVEKEFEAKEDSMTYGQVQQ